MKKWLGGTAFALVLAASAPAGDVAALVKQLQDPDADTRRAAARALGEAGTEARDAAPALVRTLRDKDRYVVQFAARALGQVGADPAVAAPALRTLLMNDQRKDVQEAAAAALGKLGGGAATALAAVAADPRREPSVRRRAVESLGSLGADARPALPVLVRLLGAPTGKKMMPPAPPSPGEVRVAAAEALGEVARTSDKEAVAALEAMVDRKQRDATLRRTAQASLQKIRGRE
jgi:HEAT repeat protein